MTSLRNVEDQAWITLATNDTYGLGALTLGKSLHRVGTTRKLVVLITPGVTSLMRDRLSEVFDLVQEVNVLDSSDAANLQLLARPDLGITFTKLHCWRLTQFKKAVFLDADVLILQNCDELFSREEFSAAPDVGWPDCFNSGVFVFQPSIETYDALIQTALTTGSFDGGDQGLLNVFFSSWATADIAKHLPFIYNMTSSSAYTYLPAYQKFAKDVKIVHFIGPVKPWMHRLNAATGRVEPAPGAYHAQEHLQSWWDIFSSEVQPHLQPELTKPCECTPQTSTEVTVAAGLAGQLSLLSLGQDLSYEQRLLDDRARQFAWEQGHMDYMGADAFSNIQKKLDEALVEKSQVQETAAAPEPPPPEPSAAPVEVPPVESAAPVEVPPVESAAAVEVPPVESAAPIEVPPVEAVTAPAASVDSLAEGLVAAALTPLIGASAESQAAAPEQPGSDAVIPLPVTPDAHFTSEISFVTAAGEQPAQTIASETVAPVPTETISQPAPSEPTPVPEVEQKTESTLSNLPEAAPPADTPAPVQEASPAAAVAESTNVETQVAPPVTLPETTQPPPLAEPIPLPPPVEPISPPPAEPLPPPAAKPLPTPPAEPLPTPPAEPLPTPPVEPLPSPPVESKSPPPAESKPLPSTKPKSPPPTKPKSPSPAEPKSPTKPKSPPPAKPKSPSPKSPTSTQPEPSLPAPAAAVTAEAAASPAAAPPKATKGKVSSPTSSQPSTPTAAEPAPPATSQPPKKTKGSKKPKSP